MRRCSTICQIRVRQTGGPLAAQLDRNPVYGGIKRHVRITPREQSSEQVPERSVLSH